jgi:hypothetical protein
MTHMTQGSRHVDPWQLLNGLLFADHTVLALNARNSHLTPGTVTHVPALTGALPALLVHWASCNRLVLQSPAAAIARCLLQTRISCCAQPLYIQILGVAYPTAVAADDDVTVLKLCTGAGDF